MAQPLDQLPTDPSVQLTTEDVASIGQFLDAPIEKPTIHKQWVVPAIAVLLFVILSLPQVNGWLKKMMGNPRSETGTLFAKVVGYAVLFGAFWLFYGMKLK